MGAVNMIKWDLFQSTLLVRGATNRKCLKQIPQQFQSTLLVRGATQSFRLQAVGTYISIHAPRERSDAVPLMLSSTS